ncbi:E3 ubiquitin-protein ligase ARIH2-like [Melopsittacus undulatus]|uniref:E3 ubiquitin-protein ligase ARIH2-like n=1 Tax=Melopsittacus undulatus TaxID=13146 RepID=UPI00124364F9|nr:E3 ubiquitin-protein ligase ARIH2-like [Melopsittacus undulatus]XP_033921760.1 E3 ubiquitin-protein ligase ARIH2-like [Melopsittacus undulatus]XP_033921761.1 E3 ubiquitin-protein ligase ARIH2-like [Melopsittacus undulatus]XP_033921762.1 E3 ubiquitin-protein ligase ARIH2-like [Melopsittacus undulatus]
MSVDMNSQGSDSNEEDYDPNCEEEEEDEDPGDIEDYYDGVANDVEQQGAVAFDPEEYQFTCLTYKESESTLNEHMATLAATLKVSHAIAKLVLVSTGKSQRFWKDTFLNPAEGCTGSKKIM